jgi:N-acetyl-anhydromuramyl-L-alanine amidase AmpD
MAQNIFTIKKNNTMQIKQHLQTKSKSAGTNTCEFFILHHTGTKENTIKGNINHLTTSGKASVHYIVDTNGDLYKI